MSTDYEKEEKDPNFPEKYARKATFIILIGTIAYCTAFYIFVISPKL